MKTSQNKAALAAGLPQPIRLDRVRTAGWLGERVDRAHRAVENVRSSIWWNLGEQWGWEHAARWVRNMSMLATHTGRTDPALAEDVERFLKMSASGELKLDYTRLKIGPYDDGEVVKGLLAYYEISGDKSVLETARKIGRYIAEHHHLTPHYYKLMAVTPLLELSAATGDRSFKDLAAALAAEQQLGFLKTKAHGAAAAMALSGYLDLYMATGERHYLDWTLEGWQAIRERMFVTGGLGECLDFAASPDSSDVLCETCQVSWWMILNLHLWRVTNDTVYLDLAERIFFNHFAFSQAHRGEGGGFYAGGNVDQGVRGVHNYFCCDNEGTLGLLELVRHIYTENTRKRVVDVNLFFDSEARFDFGRGDVTLRQTTAYPELGVVRVAVDTRTPQNFTLRVRIPHWTSVAGARINGTPVKCTIKDSYLCVARKWANGDMLSIVFPMPMRVEADMTGFGLRSGAVCVDGRDGQAKRLAVFYGPVLAAMFRTGHGNDLSWVWTGDYTDVLDSGGDAAAGYPASKPDILEQDGRTSDSGSVPELTRATSGLSVPELLWDTSLGDKVQVSRSVKVLPGLPVTLEARERVQGWNGQGRLLCSGLRFSTIKDASGGYGVCSVPYPAPCVTTKPDLDNHVVWAGVYGMYERLANDARLTTSGAICLNNGCFCGICLYDPKPVAGVVCRQTAMYTGLYLEPVPSPDLTLSCRLVFPLAAQPHNQTTVKHRSEKAAQVTARFDPASSRLILAGPVLQGAPVTIPKSHGLQPGWVIHNEKIASCVWSYDTENVMVCADVPGSYDVATDKSARIPESGE